MARRDELGAKAAAISQLLSLPLSPNGLISDIFPRGKISLCPPHRASVGGGSGQDIAGPCPALKTVHLISSRNG